MLLLLVFFIVCLGITAFAFIRKDKIFSYISFALWFLFCIYAYPQATGWDIYRGFALVGTLLAIVTLIIPFTWHSNLGEEEPAEDMEEYIDSINRQRDEIIAGARKSRRKDESW